MITCPNCGRIILDKTNAGGYKIRTRMLLFSEDKAEGICPQCKEYVELPIKVELTISENLLPKRGKIVVNK